MEQLGIGFLLGVITAGIGAVFQHQITTGARARGVKRALLAEIEENLERIGPADRSRAPTAIARSAWDLARELSLPPAVLEKLRAAYAAGEDLNARIGLVNRHFSTPVVAVAHSDAFARVTQHQDGLVDESHRRAAVARKAFETARDALKPLV